MVDVVFIFSISDPEQYPNNSFYKIMMSITFNLDIPLDNSLLPLQIEKGDIVFVLGANGSGKSSLMHYFAKKYQGRSRWISAHRQTWMSTNALEITPKDKLDTEVGIRNHTAQDKSRYSDRYGGSRPQMTLFEIIHAVNSRARKITDFVDADDPEGVTISKKEKSPITVINELLKQSNFSIQINIGDNDSLMASRDGGKSNYGAEKLSDAERNSLLIAGDVLTAKEGNLLLIDEPEKHMHRSIIAPLLGQLFQLRSDCSFVVSTHDHNLPLEIPGARTLLVRSCTFAGNNVNSWDVDFLPGEAQIDDSLRQDLLGARRKILFVEGEDTSLDKKLYSRIFRNASVIPKGNCHQVKKAVRGAEAGEDFHWLKAFGIIDGDGNLEDQLEGNLNQRVFTLPYYSVEAIYFHPKIIRRIAETQTNNLAGLGTETLFERAIKAGLNSIEQHTERLIKKAAMKLVHKQILAQIPNDNILLDSEEVTLKTEARLISDRLKSELVNALEYGEWETILKICPLKESQAIDQISKTLKYPDHETYFSAVLKRLEEDDDLLITIRGLFGDLYDQLQ